MNSLARVSGYYSLQHYGYLLQQGISGSSQLGNAKHMHEFYEIIFIEKGICYHWLEGEKQKLNANDIVIGVWIGNDDNSSMNKTTGGTLPAILWKSIAEKI